MKIFIIVFAIFSSLLILPIGSAEESSSCKRVNLLNRKWGQFPRQMPLYNQGSYGICYAYVASQMVDYWRETHGGRIGKMKMAQSTPAYAALLSRLSLIANLKKENQRFESLAGGSIGFALWAIRDMGMCQEKVIKKSFQKFAKNKRLNADKLMMLLERFFSEHRKNQSQLWGIGFVSESLKELFGKTEGLDYPKLREAMAPFIKNNNFVLFAHKVLKDCFDKRNIYLNSKKMPNYEYFILNGNPNSYKEKIGGLLSKKNAQPLGVSYCSNILTSNYANELNRRKGKVFIGPGCHLHSSLIVGQRKRKNKCQYLIRNTWGDRCRYPWPCLMRNGKAHGIWIDAEKFLRNTHQIYVIP